jgi:MATE family multidrug resistance protein
LSCTKVVPTVRNTPGTAGELLGLALPISLAQFGLVAMGLVDTAIVGRVDVDLLAGTAMGRSLALAATGLGMGVGYAMEPLAAQALGAERPDVAFAALRTASKAGVLVTIPSAGLALVAAWSLPFFGVDPKLVPISVAFLAGQLPGLFAFPLYVAAREFLAAHGATRPGLVAAVAANVLNALLGCVLVHGDVALLAVGLPALGLPRLGAFGAGVATSVASIVLAAIVLRAAARFGPGPGLVSVPMRTVFCLGLPIGLQLLAEIGVFSVVGLMAGALGSTDAAAHQVALALASFTFMGVYGIGAAAGILVGHAVGAGRSPSREGMLGMLLGAATMATSALAFAAFPVELVSLFTVDRDVVALGSRLLLVAAFFQVFDGLQAVASGALRGAGDVRFPFVAHFVSHYLVGLPVAALLGVTLKWGAVGLWWGIAAGLVTVSLSLVARFFWIVRRGVLRVV